VQSPSYHPFASFNELNPNLQMPKYSTARLICRQDFFIYYIQALTTFLIAFQTLTAELFGTCCSRIYHLLQAALKFLLLNNQMVMLFIQQIIQPWHTLCSLRP
jgi:predicted small integral membrane protein